MASIGTVRKERLRSSRKGRGRRLVARPRCAEDSPDHVGRTDSPEDVALAHRRGRTNYYKIEESSRESEKPI